MKKILLFASLLFFLASCTSKQDITQNVVNNNLEPISNSVENWVLVWVSDPHIFSHKGPLIYSWSYYFNPRIFYNLPSDLSVFTKAYSNNFDDKKVYYYDENDGAQAGIIVYVLRNIFHKNNVSLLLNGKIKRSLHYSKWFKIPENILKVDKKVYTWWYIGTWKYLIAYNPSKIKFQTGDLLLYASDIGTMKLDSFYKQAKWLNIESLDWTKLISFEGNLKKIDEIQKITKPLNLQKYKRIFIYYPKYWYRSWILALILQN